MTCPQALHTQAYFDGELDAASSASLELHLEGCAECQTRLDELAETAQQVRAAFAFGASPQLRERITTTLDNLAPVDRIGEPKRFRPRLSAFWSGAFSGAGGGFVTAMLVAFFMFAPARNEGLLDAVLSEHIESLTPGHLIAVESSDRHTVKPWFAGRTAVSPVVADFPAEGFVLLGGRTDYVNHEWAAVVVYRAGQHLVNVFSWRVLDHGVPSDSTRDGYRLVFWEVGGLQYCAVSDANWQSLNHLRKLLQEQAESELRGP